MDITLIPFNRLVGIGHSTVPGFLLELDASPSHANHLGGVHAGAQLALAEATSAEGLLRAFPDLASSSVPVVRRLESRFRRPAQGTLRSRASIAEEADRKFRADYSAKGRGLIEVNVEVVDAGGSVTLTATVEWFIQKRSRVVGITGREPSSSSSDSSTSSRPTPPSANPPMARRAPGRPNFRRSPEYVATRLFLH